MQISPWFLGACALACVTGGMAGASISSDPMSRTDRQWMDAIPRHEPAYAASTTPRNIVAPHDQYDLETPTGVIPVAELAYHGRLRDRRRDQPYYFAPEPSFDESEVTLSDEGKRYSSDPSLDYRDAPAGESVSARPIVELDDAPFVPLDPTETDIRPLQIAAN